MSMYKYVSMFTYKHVYVHACFCIIKQTSKYVWIHTDIIEALECKIVGEFVYKKKCGYIGKFVIFEYKLKLYLSRCI